MDSRSELRWISRPESARCAYDLETERCQPLPRERAMRVVPAALIIVALPLVAAAQSSGSAERPFSGLGPIGLPLPSINSALPPIGLGLPPLGLPPQKAATTRTRGQRPDRAGQRARGDSRRNVPPHTTV